MTPRYATVFDRKVDDASAASGEAMVFEGDPGWTTRQVEFKCAGLAHVLDPSALPRDGQCHLYRLGRTTLLGNDLSVKAVAGGKVVGRLNLGCRVSARDRAAEWDVYVSARLAGPSFADGDGAKDLIYLERALLVRAKRG